MSPRVRLLACAASLLVLGPPAAVAGAHDGPHASVPVAQGHMRVGGSSVPFGYHSDAVAAVPDEKVVGAVARAAWARVPDVAVGAADEGLAETWCGDPVPTLAPGASSPDDVANRVFGNSTPQFKVIYAYAADQPSRFDQLAHRLQANVSLLSRFMAGQSGDTKTLRFDMGTSCGAGYADIQVIRLPRNLAAYAGPDFDLLADDVRGIVAGSQTGPRDWIVYADRMRVNGVAGTGEFYYGPIAEAPAATSHDAGRLVSVVWGLPALPNSSYADPTTMLHEMAHNLGAVQGNAPNSTGFDGGIASGHCTDEWDVMCYADGGPDNAMTYPCTMRSGTVTETFDCGGDDYFNPIPSAGSWLASHWNVYASAMLGACSGDLAVACGAESPPAPAPINTTRAAPTGWTPAPYAVKLAGTNATRWQWRVDGGLVGTTAAATVTGAGVHVLETRVGSPDGVWTPWRSETIRLDGGPPAVAITCTPLDGDEHACAATAHDADSGVAGVTISGGGAPLAVASGQAVRFTAPQLITATATDHAGLGATAQRVLAVDPAPATTTRTVPVPLAARRGRIKGRARLILTSAGAQRSARLAVGRVRVPAGTWRIAACLRQTGQRARCRTRTARLTRAGRLPSLAVVAQLAGGSVEATVDVARRQGRRYGKPVLAARASGG